MGRYPGTAYPDNIPNPAKAEYPGEMDLSVFLLTYLLSGLYDQSLYNGASQGISDFQARMSAFGAGFAGIE